MFTRFWEMVAPLTAFLQAGFQRDGFFLHGSTAVKKHQKMVAMFQKPDYIPFMVLSFEVGGVGLNLTAANWAVPFDRWWNPVVKIMPLTAPCASGKHPKVLVHMFITTGTIEDKIDRMLDKKSRSFLSACPTSSRSTANA